MTFAIQVEQLSKRYMLQGKRERYVALRDVLTENAKRIFRPVEKKLAAEEFWALQDVSFDLKQGARLGVIGKNGAGKSTLLKLLSRITEPTKGSIKIKSRIASLLEVGTGFHPELTGRENIYLNGAILGMGREEIRRKFDEIVAFAEVEKFLDTPVKRYSSGMYVRLAFAVAAHLEPEILIVDEVLAVGDVHFQKKCLGKMESVAKEGRTVLFVSHNMGAIQNLCETTIVLDQGRLTFQGDTPAAISHYLHSLAEARKQKSEYIARNSSVGASLLDIDYVGEDGKPISSLQIGSPAAIRLTFQCERPLKNALISIGINSFDNSRVAVLHTTLTDASVDLTSPFATLYCLIPRMSLVPGLYRLDVKVMAQGDVVFWLPSVCDLDVVGGDYFGTGRLPDDSWGGITLLDHRWHSLPSLGQEGMPLSQFQNQLLQ